MSSIPSKVALVLLLAFLTDTATGRALTEFNLSTFSRSLTFYISTFLRVFQFNNYWFRYVGVIVFTSVCAFNNAGCLFRNSFLRRNIFVTVTVFNAGLKVCTLVICYVSGEYDILETETNFFSCGWHFGVGRIFFCSFTGLLPYGKGITISGYTFTDGTLTLGNS